MNDAPPEKGDGSEQAPAAPDEDEVPIPEPPAHAPRLIPDPYARAGVSPTAVWSVLSAIFLGPVGAILAIFLGVHARRQIARTGARRSGASLAFAGIVLGTLLVPAWGVALSYLVWAHVHHDDAPTASDEPGEAPSLDDPADPTQGAPPAQDVPRSALVTAPKETRVKQQGGITVVDLGTEVTSLSEELARQRAEAARQGETLLVMTTAGRCAPCRGVDASLSDARLQTALAKVRLVRVDVVAFHEDLDALRIPDERFPGFFLLAPDLTPRDGIDGGEWDDDIPANIAPVLGAFLRGKYTTRREPWHTVPGSGMAL